MGIIRGRSELAWRVGAYGSLVGDVGGGEEVRFRGVVGFVLMTPSEARVLELRA